jgi:hypothetical protein
MIKYKYVCTYYRKKNRILYTTIKFNYIKTALEDEIQFYRLV